MNNTQLNNSSQLERPLRKDTNADAIEETLQKALKWLDEHPATRPNQRSRLANSQLEAIAAGLCATVFAGRSAEGYFEMDVTDLCETTALPLDQLEAAITWAIENAWLRRSAKVIALRAAGIHVAKQTLDLPR